MLKIQYANNTERESILLANSNRVLKEEHNLFEGNFLLFADDDDIETKVLATQKRLDEVENTIYEMILGGGSL